MCVCGCVCFGASMLVSLQGVAARCLCLCLCELWSLSRAGHPAGCCPHSFCCYWGLCWGIFLSTWETSRCSIARLFLWDQQLLKPLYSYLQGAHAVHTHMYIYIYMVHPSQMSTSFCVDWHLRCFMHIVSSLFGEQSKFEVKAGAIYIYICIYSSVSWLVLMPNILNNFTLNYIYTPIST